MPTRPTATQTATRIWREQFHDAVALFCGGSVARGEETPHSDLDIVVLFETLPNAWRESQIVDGWPVELFVHDLETLTHFVEQDCLRRQPSLASMLADATVIPKSSTLSDKVQKWAVDILKTPPPVSAADLDDNRYFVTDLLDDLRDERPRSEMIAIAVRLHDQLGSLILKSRGHWSGTGKHLPRRLRELDPELAAAFQRAFDTLFVNSAPAALIAFSERILEPLGGTLFAGYRSDAPPTARSTPPDLAR